MIFESLFLKSALSKISCKRKSTRKWQKPSRALLFIGDPKGKNGIQLWLASLWVTDIWCNIISQALSIIEWVLINYSLVNGASTNNTNNHKDPKSKKISLALLSSPKLFQFGLKSRRKLIWMEFSSDCSIEIKHHPNQGWDKVETIGSNFGLMQSFHGQEDSIGQATIWASLRCLTYNWGNIDFWFCTLMGIPRFLEIVGPNVNKARA